MCARALTKFILIIFNVIFVILGTVVFGIGLWAKLDDDGFAAMFSRIPSSVLNNESGAVDIPALVSSAALVLIIGGAFILLVGFLGCCGAWKEVSCFLIIYVLILVLLIIIELAFVIVMYAAKDKIEKHLFKFLSLTIENGFVGGTDFKGGKFHLTEDSTTLAWDMTQLSLECCGVLGIDDYLNASKWDHTVVVPSENGTETVIAAVPLSCCRLVDPSVFPDKMADMKFVNLYNCLTEPSDATANLNGCYKAVEAQFMKYSNIAAYVGLAVILTEILGLLCACWLTKTINKEKAGYEKA